MMSREVVPLLHQYVHVRTLALFTHSHSKEPVLAGWSCGQPGGNLGAGELVTKTLSLLPPCRSVAPSRLVRDQVQVIEAISRLPSDLGRVDGFSA